MSPAESLDQILSHQIEIAGLSLKENLKLSALDLMSRATALHQASQQLRMKYTYQIIETTIEKQQARQQIGEMAAGIIEAVRDELITVAIKEWNDAHQ